MEFKERCTLFLHDRYRLAKCIFAVLAFIIALVTYLSTMAPTVSFWDCGEFISVAFTLGIPHPPGAPFFEMLCHLFSMVKIFAEESMRINFVSAFSSALTVVFMYLIIARTIEYWCKETSTFIRGAVVIGGAFSGAMANTFSGTFWFSAVEAEVYGLAVLMMFFCTWLTLVWMEKYQERGKEKILVFLIYIMFLASGVHLAALTIVPAILLLVLWVDKDMRTNWKPYVIGIALSTLIYAVMDFIFLLYAFNIAIFLKVVVFRRNWPAWFAFFVGAVLLFAGVKLFSFAQVDVLINFWSMLFFIVFVGLLFVFKENTRYNSSFWFWVVFAALMAYSVQSFIPIRSSLNPNIDENNPEKWESFQGFLERKQYGQESMVASMFKRRTTWTEQFGVNPNCGYWGFFRQQYVQPLHNLHFIPIAIGLFGLWVKWRRERRSAMFLTACFLVNTLGLLLYLNFKIDEVRERDYFYGPGFAFFTYWIGIGMAGIIYSVTNLIKQEGFLKKLVVGLTAFACMIAPAAPVLATIKYKDERSIYFTHSRAGDYIPWDYAYNILMTCAQNGIIFTNGDNDTFPLWALQEVYKVRTDVKIVNLSLLNTPWYIKQLRDNNPKIAIRFTDDYIDNKVVPMRIPKDGMIYAGGLPVKLQKGQIFRVQDWMIIEIINSVNWEKPIYFAVTVSENNKLGLDEYMTMEGMAFRMYPQKVASNLDAEKTRHNLYEVYKYRGLTDPNVYKDDNSQKLLSNYNAAYFQLALKYHNELNQSDEAIRTLARADSLIGIGWRGYYLMSQIYSKMGKSQEAVDKLNLVLKEKPEEIGVYMNLGGLYYSMGKNDEAAAAYEKVLAIKPNVGQAYQMLERLYAGQKQFGKITQLINRWLTINPGDSTARQRLAAYQSQMQAGSAPAAPAVKDTNPKK